MTKFLTDYGIVVALGCAAAAVVYGLLVTQRLLAKSPGNDRMQEISGAVQEGASAYLKRQYMIIAGVGVVVAILLIPLQNVETAIGFVIGGIFSGAAGFIGMNLSVRANARVAEAARGGIPPALDIAFKGGSVTGLLVVGLALLGVAGYFGALLIFTNLSDKDCVDALVGLGFGGSLISVFARLGGGIFTKAADVGADLVGKIEAGIPEDDPRNPAVIADNVGDNVGDCAGMAADLFETYAVTAVAVMLLGVITFTGFTREVAIYPLAIGAVAIIASIIGALSVRTRTGNVEAALYRGLAVSAVLSAAAFYPITKWLMNDPLSGERPRQHDRHRPVALRPDRRRRHRAALRAHRLLHVNPLPAGADHLQGLGDGSRDQHHPGPRAGPAVDGPARAGDRHRDPRLLEARRRWHRRHLRHRRRGDGAALADRADRRPGRVRPDHRQRGRHRGDGRPAPGRARHHRPARRGRATRRRPSPRAMRSARPRSPRWCSSTPSPTSSRRRRTAMR